MNRVKRWQIIGQTLGSFTYPRDLPLVAGALRQRRRYECPPHIWNTCDALGGFLRPSEAGLIYKAATQWPLAGPVIELGSYAGRSTVVFALGDRQVHSVDAWSLDVTDLSAYHDGQIAAHSIFEQFRTNLARSNVTDKVRLHRGLTQEIGRTWQIPCAILFVDAGHTYEDASGDLRIWTQFLLPDGLLLMHDVFLDGFPGVKRAASELLRQGWRVIASADSLVAFVRK
jgi:MMP 1-O-methyltransferase